MAQFELFLLGAPRVILDGAPVSFDTRKAIALLAYLAVTGQPQQRDALAALLWPDADQSHARGALRRTLSVVHAALQRTAHLRIEREQVTLDVAAPGVTCDVRSFLHLAAGCTSHADGGAQPAQCDDCLHQLEQAAAVYADHFMAGFSLRDSAAYDDWQFFQGEELRRTLSHVLELLVNCHSLRHNWQPAISHARRRLALDTLHEPAHRQLMLLFAWANQRAAALRQYQECRRILDEELGVPPLGETTELYQAILNHQPPAAPAKTPPAAAPPPASAPAVAPARPEFAEPLVGRQRQWQALEGAYAAISATGSGHLAVIEGEGGAGKTRLAQAFLAHLRSQGAATAAAVCYSGEEGLAFAPVEQLLRNALEQPAQRARLGGVEAAWLREVQRLLPDLHALTASDQRHADQRTVLPADALGSQSHFLEGIMRTLACLLQGAVPGAILLDDVHAADGATLDLLAYLVRRLRTLPLLVLVTWSATEVTPNHRLRQMAAEATRRHAGTLLTLPPFDVEAIAHLLAANRQWGALPATVDRPQLAARLLAETQGLPLFVAEYIDLLKSGALDAGASAWPAPHGVRQFLHTRMAALSETAQQVVSTAAVIGRSFDLETVIAASGRSEEESVRALEELLARRLILEQGGHSFDFAHAQLRSLVYEETSQVRRRLLHRRVADALAVHTRRNGAESGGMSASTAAALTHHYQLGGSIDKAAHWAAVAGEQARQVYANREAIAHFNLALSLGAVAFGDAIPYVIHVHLGDLHTLQGEYAQALNHYQTAQRACEIDDKNADSGYGRHSGKEGEIEHRLGRLHLRLGGRNEAMQHFARALDLLPADATADRAMTLADWSLAAYGARNLPEAVRLAQAALHQAQAAGDRSVLGRVYDILSLIERKQNNLPAAIEHAERSLAAAAALRDPAAELAALNSLALAHAAGGAHAEAIPIIQAALERCVRLGDRHQEAALRNNLADLYHATDQHDAAMDELKRAVAIFAEIGAEAGPDNAEIWMLSEW